MRKIIFGLVLIIGAGAAIAAGATGAFFSDTETSTGNTFAAGAIDLKVDNESYYNGNKCAFLDARATTTPGFYWQGSSIFPAPDSRCTTSWELSDLTNTGRLFFNFTDIKPDDEGEDTISLHVDNNPAYACMDVTLTSNDDNSSVDPEIKAGDTPPDDPNNSWDGELAENLRMFWWADDGDNVYEQGETTISGGVKTLLALASTTGPYSVALADSQNNVWSPTNTPGPLPGNTTKYIAKAWCFGNMAVSPIAQDGLGAQPNSANGPQVRGTGIICNGTTLNNLTQTDGATLDVAFRTVQSRHNSDFTCGGTRPRFARLTVVKHVINDDGGDNIVSDFHLFVDDGFVSTPVTSSSTVVFADGAYTVGETGISGYAATFSGDCNAFGEVTLAPGDHKVCNLTNNDKPAIITLIKNVINNNGGTATPDSIWGLSVDGQLIQNNTSTTTRSNTPHFLDEKGRVGYHFVSITGTGCPFATSTPIVLNEGESVTCTITNDDN